MKCSLLLPLLLLAGPAYRSTIAQATAAATGGDASANAQQLLQKLVEKQRTWGPENSTPGMSLTVNEEDRVESNSNSAIMAKVGRAQQFGPTLTFSLRAIGVPKDKTYSLVSWPVDLPMTAKAPLTLSRGVTLDPHGTALRGGDEDHPLTLPLRPAPGEPVRLGLVSTDGAVKIFARIVPLPLEGKDHGCRISATLLTRNGEVVMFEGSGFQPNEEIDLNSVSGKEARKQPKHADASGNFMTVDLPYVQGQDHGNVKMTLKAAKCSPSVTVPWGRQ